MDNKLLYYYWIEEKEALIVINSGVACPSLCPGWCEWPSHRSRVLLSSVPLVGHTRVSWLCYLNNPHRDRTINVQIDGSYLRPALVFALLPSGSVRPDGSAVNRVLDTRRWARRIGPWDVEVSYPSHNPRRTYPMDRCWCPSRSDRVEKVRRW